MCHVNRVGFRTNPAEVFFQMSHNAGKVNKRTMTMIQGATFQPVAANRQTVQVIKIANAVARLRPRRVKRNVSGAVSVIARR